jgi:hypothetical protein
MLVPFDLLSFDHTQPSAEKSRLRLWRGDAGKNEQDCRGSNFVDRSYALPCKSCSFLLAVLSVIGIG